MNPGGEIRVCHCGRVLRAHELQLRAIEGEEALDRLADRLRLTEASLSGAHVDDWSVLAEDGRSRWRLLADAAVQGIQREDPEAWAA